jgi:predicted ABC-type ATPase
MVDSSGYATNEVMLVKDDEDCRSRLALNHDPSAKRGTSAFTLWLMAGFAGAGKTTLAQWLDKKLEEDNDLNEWKIVSRDALKLRRLEQGEQEEQAGYNAFEDMLRVVQKEVVKQGRMVVVDTSNERPFIVDTINKMLQSIEEQHGIHIQLKVILCVANEEIRAARLHRRGSMFAPHVQTLPDVLDDSQWVKRFHHLFASDPAILVEFEALLSNPTQWENWQEPVNLKHKVLIVNTNHPFDTYAPEVWAKFKQINLLEKNKFSSPSW